MDKKDFSGQQNMFDTSDFSGQKGEYNGQPVVLVKSDKKHDTESSFSEGWKDAFLDFTQNTTLHGLRYIWIVGAFRLRKLLWLILLLAGTGIMCYQIIDRIIYYYKMPVNVNVEVNFNRSLYFPAVTICNQNAFRATAAARDGRFQLIQDMYSDAAVNFWKYQVENITLDDFRLNATHQKEDLVVQCTWDGRPCSADNFTMVMTDHGICYTLQGDESLQVHSAGSESGLHLTLNIEQYEYMPRPHGSAGLKIFMHDKRDTPLVGELGFALPVGSHSFVGNSLLVVENLPPPYGVCGEKSLKYFDFYSSANCKLDCLTHFVDKKCSCRDIFMPHIQGYPPICTLRQGLDCLYPALGNFQSGDHSDCGCQVPCDYAVYQPTLSYATISDFVIDRLLAKVNSEKLGEKFMASKEVTNRYEVNTFQKFKSLVDNVQGKFNKVQTLLMKDIPEKLAFLYDKMATQRKYANKIWYKKGYIYRYQNFMMQKNFLRGRDAMEERTLGQVAGDFQGTALRTESRLQELANTSLDRSEYRAVLYHLLSNEFDVRAEMVRRGMENLTALINSYQNGTPVFGYKFRRNPRSLNNYVIPKPLLRYALIRTKNARNYGLGLIPDLQKLLNIIADYKSLVDGTYMNGSLDELAMKNLTNYYEEASKKFYGNRANLYFESIDWAAEEIQRRKDKFIDMKLRVDKSFDDMEHNIESLNSSLFEVQQTILQNLASGCDMARMYLSNETISKLELSKALTSVDIHEGVNTMKVFLQEVRSRGQNIFDDWTDLLEGISKIWTNILDDDNSIEYYQYKNMTEFLQNKTRVLFQLEVEIIAARDYGDLRDVIQNKGRIFLKALYDIMDDAEDFMSTTTLDGDFLRDNFVFLNIYYSELSYEQLTHQEAYGLFPLLCDIGGSMGLFIGASVLTMFEIIDVFVNQSMVAYCKSRKKTYQKPTKV